MTGMPAAFALAIAGTTSRDPDGVSASAFGPRLDQVLNDLHLSLDVDLAFGRLDDQLDAEPARCLFGPTLHLNEEGAVQRLQHQGDPRTAGTVSALTIAPTRSGESHDRQQRKDDTTCMHE